MISKRFINDSKPLLQLNPLQIEKKLEVTKKVDSGHYQFEEVNCPICNQKQFEKLAEKDRYGLKYSVVICKSCGLVQTNPRMNQIAYKEFYNNEYRNLYVGTKNPTNVFFQAQYNKANIIYQFLESNGLFNAGSSSFILEIGCGAGGILEFFKQKGCAVKGIDLGEEYLAYGRENYNLDLSFGTIHDLTLQIKPDIIIYSHVLEHILDLNKELEKLKEICSEETIIYIEVPGLKNVHKKYKMDFLLYFQNAHTFHFSLTTLKNLFISHGYSLLVGSEYIRSAFQLNFNSSKTVENDYILAKKYISSTENYKFLYPIRNFHFRRDIKKSVLALLEIVKLKEVIKKLIKR